MVKLGEKWVPPCLRICEVGQLSNPHIQVNYFSLLASIPLRALAPTNAYFPPVPGTCIKETFRAEENEISSVPTARCASYSLTRILLCNCCVFSIYICGNLYL